MKHQIITITSHLEMVGFIKTNSTSCRFVSIVTETPVVKIKKNCPYQGVVKISRKQGMVNANYNTAVRKRIAEKLGVEIKEVEYTNGDIWYRHIQTEDGKPLPLVVHKKTFEQDGEYYLQYYPSKSTNAYRLANGDTVTEEQLQPYLYAQPARSDYKPAVISIKVSNIKELRSSGVIMQDSDLADAEAALAEA